MNKEELTKRVSRATDYPIEPVKDIVRAVFKEMERALIKDEPIIIYRFATFTPRYKPATKRYNPATHRNEILPKRKTVDVNFGRNIIPSSPFVYVEEKSE